MAGNFPTPEAAGLARLVIVDDHEPTRLLVGRIVTQELGARVALAGTCEEALHRAEADTYDVILLGRVYHDVIYEGGDFIDMTQRFYRMLKPGGHVMVEDHDADDGEKTTSWPAGRSVRSVPPRGKTHR